jgi:hypothetical protein
MIERRKAKRFVLQAPGRLVLEDAEHACVIWDRSKTGARLIEFGDVELPHVLTIHMRGAAEAQPCWLIWQSEGEAGVSFVKP